MAMLDIAILSHVMNQSEFNILITNVAAITNQIFTFKCGEFASQISGDVSNNQTSNKIDYEKYMADFNAQEMLASGYESIDTLALELEDVWNGVDQESLYRLASELPANLPDITTRLTPDQFKLWIVYALEASDDNPLYELHKYITGSLGAGHCGDVYDSIREAIAFDELTGLIENEHTILPEHIRLDDLITAASIQSFKVFEWLMKRAKLDDQQIVDLLDSNITDPNTFEKMYKIIIPTDAQCKKIQSIAIIKNEDAVVRFLEKFNGV